MEIVSTMSSGSLGREIDLETLVSELENHLGELVDANFHGPSMVTVRLKENGPAYTIYRTGTFQICGAETEELLTESHRRFKEVLDEIAVNTSETEFMTSLFWIFASRKIIIGGTTIVSMPSPQFSISGNNSLFSIVPDRSGTVSKI